MWSLWRTVTNTSQVCPLLPTSSPPWSCFPENGLKQSSASNGLPQSYCQVTQPVQHYRPAAPYPWLPCCFSALSCTISSKHPIFSYFCSILWPFVTFVSVIFFFVLTFVFFGSSTNFYDISFCHFPPLNHLFPFELFSRKITLCVVSVRIWKTVQIEPSKTVSLWSNF